MPENQWTEVDTFIAGHLTPPDESLDAVLRSSEAAGLPPIQVAPNQGKLLYLLAKMLQARNILEIGTLGGYSSIWLGRALPADGHLISLEADPKHAEVARANISRAGLDRVVEVRLGRALDVLPKLAAGGAGPFDLIFIDADKPPYPEYFDWAIKLSRKGSVIVADNVVRHGEVIDESDDDPGVRAIRRLYDRIGSNPHVSATAIQTVGVKGYDGFIIALVTADPTPA